MIWISRYKISGRVADTRALCGYNTLIALSSRNEPPVYLPLRRSLRLE